MDSPKAPNLSLATLNLNDSTSSRANNSLEYVSSKERQVLSVSFKNKESGRSP